VKKHVSPDEAAALPGVSHQMRTPLRLGFPSGVPCPLWNLKKIEVARHRPAGQSGIFRVVRQRAYNGCMQEEICTTGSLPRTGDLCVAAEAQSCGSSADRKESSHGDFQVGRSISDGDAGRGVRQTPVRGCGDKRSTDPKVADRCKKLAAQEGRHYERFKAMKEAHPERDQTCGGCPWRRMSFVEGLIQGRVTPLEAEAKRVAR